MCLRLVLDFSDVEVEAVTAVTLDKVVCSVHTEDEVDVSCEDIEEGAVNLDADAYWL